MHTKWNNQIEKMQYSAEIIRAIGNAKINSHGSLRDYFCLKGINIWEVVEPTIAAFEFPRLLDADKNTTERLKYKIRSRLAPLKYKVLRKKEIKNNKNSILFDNIKKNKIDILLFGFSGYMERDVLAPLVRPISNAKLKHYVISDSYSSSTANDKNNVSRLNIWSLWDNECQNELVQLEESYSILMTEFSHETICDLYEICKYSCSISIFKEFIKYVFNALIPNYFHYIIVAEKIYRNTEVNWNFSPDVSDPRVRAFCLLARNYKVMWADVQFGIYSLESVEWNFCKSDLVFVWGQFFRDLLIQFNVKSSKIIITGSPKFDNLIINKSNLDSLKCKENSVVNVLFCSMYSLKSYTNISKFDSTLKLIKTDVIKHTMENPNINLIFKLHPLESDNQIKKLVRRISNIIIVDGAVDIRPYIKECDVFITMGSTSTIDAILLEKPIIYANYEGLVWWDDIYLKSEISVQAKNSKCMKNILDNINLVIQENEDDETIRNRNKFINKLVCFSNEESSIKILRATGFIQ
jgi:hypothetical protein